MHMFQSTNSYKSVFSSHENSGPCDWMVGVIKNVTFAVIKSEFCGVNEANLFLPSFLLFPDFSSYAAVRFLPWFFMLS